MNDKSKCEVHYCTIWMWSARGRSQKLGKVCNTHEKSSKLQTLVPGGAKSEVRQSRERMRWCGLMVWGRQIETQMCNSILQHSQLKMPGGGCWVTTGQFSSSLLSPQLFSWLQISEPRRKQFPLVQWNLHSLKAFVAGTSVSCILLLPTLCQLLQMLRWMPTDQP